MLLNSKQRAACYAIAKAVTEMAETTDELSLGQAEAWFRNSLRGLGYEPVTIEEYSELTNSRSKHGT